MAVSPAGGLLADAAPSVSVADMLSQRSPGERPAGARSDKLPLPTYRVKSAILVPEAPSELAEELATIALSDEPVASFAEADLDLPLIEMAALAPARSLPRRFYAVGSSDSDRTGPAPPILVPEVPEPTSWLTMLVGFGCLGAAMRMRGRRAIGPLSAGRG